MIFMLDNFDSFTYNLYQYFGELGEKIVVKRQDTCTLAEIEVLNPDLIVISPGPCTPSESPFSLTLIDYFKEKIPILGVCLGHQAIGQFFGGKVVRAKQPIHGKTDYIHHDGRGLFSGLPNPLEVTRYHSLIIERSSLPEELTISAETKDGEIMGLRHISFPIEGIQFHPEAILTQAGRQLLRNALENALRWKPLHQPSEWTIKPFACQFPPHIMFQALRNEPSPFFLDSGDDYQKLGCHSFLGAAPFLEATAYPEKLEITWPNGLPKTKTVTPALSPGSFDFLDNTIRKYHVSNSPFPFSGGAVGFISYDLKDEIEHLPHLSINDLELPLWRFAWYDGVIVYDHSQKNYWLVACGIDKDGICRHDLAEARIRYLEHLLNSYTPSISGPLESPAMNPKNLSKIKPTVTKENYLRDLKHVIEYIYAGDIYQANLTQRFSLSWSGDPWSLYSELHLQNPAPFAAFLYYSDFQILCSSPERFIRITKNGQIETRPIKGTRPRSESPLEDEAQAQSLLSSQKDRAELTMIIDLERNDLGRICQFGSVKVTNLITLEKYPTVWHLVSAITGQLKKGLQPSEILQAIFPGGSITGAPKIRAMEIIDELEPNQRGIYTGSIGYIGFDGAWDLNIVIRTILLKNGKAYIHAGGGIVADSIPADEYQETLDKAKALFRVLKGQLHDSH
ncbi:aminodeoxychorismate synthase component I [Desulfosporosinus sp. FKA]|uniref:aminodeoxychorismate synthase component I n=1 Tax=Desulfosporosinus sp. FKA TaxID=1969834 RepID=UPI000B4A172D|nr:aminodeoxychorismate synthase component I [Desulfosporosinus sp. FKA]